MIWHKELKTFTVNMKSLDQHIEDPVVAGAGDANGRTLRIIFTQEAEAQFGPETKVYLKWYHQKRKVSGYDIFDHVKDDPPVWEIHYPKKMLFEGDVLCSIELVDDISICPSTSFHVHVLADPHDGTDFTDGNDYSVFQDAVLDMNNTVRRAKKQMKEQQEQFEDMRREFNAVKEVANAAYDMAIETAEKVDIFINSPITAFDISMNEY